MVRDSYKGKPKRFHPVVDKDGSLHIPHPDGLSRGGDGGAFSPFVVGSGILVAGNCSISNSHIGWHTNVILTPVSGSVTTALSYVVDPVAKLIKVNGSSSTDTRRFTYALFNPGLGSRKP